MILLLKGVADFVMPIKEILEVKLFPDWVDYYNKSKRGYFTYIKKSCKTINPLQISYLLYKDGKMPNPTFDDLLKMCIEFGTKYKCDLCLGKCYGECVFGRYASAIFKTNEFQWYQVWHLSNGKDFMFVTYICEDKPEDYVLEEAHEIVMNLNLKFEQKRWWKL